MTLPAPKHPLQGRVVLVTGGGAGLGQAICLATAAKGARVVVTATRDNGAETARQVEALGGEALFVRTDVTKSAAVKAAIDAALDRYGQIDAIVHNATARSSSGVTPIVDLTEEEWDDHLLVTLRGAYLLAHHGVGALTQSKGRYVLMTSSAGLEGSAARPAYSAVKGSIRGFTKSLALEWGPLGIAVTCISPLATTPALENAFKAQPDLEGRLAALSALGRVGNSLTDVAPVVSFLIGDDAGYITGQTIVVDGGRCTAL